MKRLISLLLLITMGLALCACDSFTVTFNPNQFTTNETSSDGTTPEIPGTLVDPTAVSFEIVPSTEYSFSFRVVIQSEAEDAYIDLKTFFNEFLSQSFFDGITYDEMLEDFDWFVDNKLADGTTKLFNNIVISFNLKIDGSQSPEETSSEPEVTTPEVTTPEVTTPEVTTPEVTTPEVTAPEVTTPEVTTPEVTTPEVTTPEVTTPEVTTPEVTTPSTPETPDKPATIIPQVVEKPVANTGYKYFLKQSNINQTLYFTGLMENTYYLGTTTNPTEAVDVGFEPVEGKDGEYYLYFMDGAIKTYIVAYEGTKTDGSKVASLKLSIRQEEANVWTFNTEHNTPVAKLNIGGVENTYYIGAYNTFQTFSLSKISYLPSKTSFAAQFATLLNTSVISDADKVAAEKEALTIKTEIKEDCVIELPVFGSVFEQVRISWASNNEFAVINGNTLTVTQQKDVQTVTLTATITSGDITDTKKFTVTITAIPTAVPQIVETPVAGTEYYFGLYQGNLNSLLFITGEMKGYYYETTDDIDAAIKVVLEAVPGKDGVFYLSTTVGGAKKYLNIVKSANGLHNNVVYDDTAISEYIYNTEYKTVTTVLGEETFFFGTYNTYNTFSASTIDKASGNFVAHFYKLGDTPEDPDTPNQPGAKDPAADSTLTIEQAIALGSSKEHNTYTEGKYYVTGVITEIKSTIWGNMYIKDENGNSIYVYGVYNADGSARYDAMDVQPQIGDTITVYGIIGQYNGTPQMKNVWIVAHSAEAPEETTPEETTPDTPDIPAEPEAGTFVGVIHEIALANGWEKAISYDSFIINDRIIVSFTATPVNYELSSGKYYTSDTSWRLYQNESPELTIATLNGENIVCVKVTYISQKYGVLTLNGGNIESEAIVSVNNNSITFGVGNTNAETKGQVRITAIEVILDGSWTPEGPEITPPEVTTPEEPEVTTPEETTPDEPVVIDPPAESELTIEEAIALGSSKEHNTYTEGKYYVTGVVQEIKHPSYGNMYIVDENGNSIYVYGTWSADGSARYDAMTVKPVPGDTVTIYGIIGQYNDTPQIKNGWLVAHEATAPSVPEETTPPPTEETTPATPEVKDPPAESELTVEEAIALGASKEHNTYTEGKYYVTGVITEVYNTTYGNMRITDEYGNILTLYGTWSADGSARYDAMDVQPIAGDIITVYGIIGQYGGTPQIKNGWIVAHEATAPSVPEETTPEETTPIPDVPVDPDTPVALDSIGFQFILPIESYSYIFRAIIDADDGAYIDLESFFNLTLSPALFGNMTFDEVPEGINWYVDGKLAQASTPVFSGYIVSLKAANSDDTTPPTLPETPIAPDNIGFRFISSSSNKVTFRAIIDADDGTCVDLATFVESIIAPIMFGEGVTYEQSLAEGDWLVDDQSADAVTKLFSGSTVIFVEKDAPSQSPEDDDGKTTIVFYHTMGANLQEVLDIYIEEFNKLYPDIIVEHKQVGGYDDVCDQIKTEIVSGTHPNIAYCYPDHVALYNIAKAVQPLDDLIGSTNTVTRADGTLEQIGLTQEQIDNFIDAFYNEGRAFGDGLMYTMPMSKSTEVLYYNKTFFEKHNIKVPTTWDEMEAVCQQLKTIDPDCIPLGYDSEANWFITMCEQYGSPYTSATGDHFLFDNETNRNFVARFREWYQKGYVTTQELTGSYTSSLFTMDPSERANCYMCIASSAGAYHYRSGFEVGIAPIPQVDPTSPKVISQGPSLCIFKDADEDEVLASWLFVKFLITNVDFQAEFSMNSGYMPVLESVVEHPVYADFLENANGHEGLLMQAIKVAFEQADAYFTSPAFVGSSEARDQVGILLQYCMCDNSAATAEGIKKAFERAIEECNYQIGN